MQAIIPSNPDEPIIYDIMGLNDAASRFYKIPRHDIYLDATTPTYDPSTLDLKETPLTAVQHLQLAAHPGHTSQDIHCWGGMEASKFKWFISTGPSKIFILRMILLWQLSACVPSYN